MSGILPRGLRLIDRLLQEVFQCECAACGRHGVALEEGLCRFCRIWFPLRGPLCDRCGNPLTLEMGACGECQRRPRPALTAARSLLWLEESTLGLLHRIKYGKRYEYLELFRPVIVQGFQAFFDTAPIVVPVPLHVTKLAARGFNQAEILARALARCGGWRCEVDRLSKVRVTDSQATLTLPQRQRNLRGSFLWRGGPPVPAALLVDDVYTTGATLEACAKVLKRGGVERVYAWTLFRTPRSS